MNILKLIGLSLLLLVAGCATRGGNNAFPQDVKIPTGGDPLPAEFWEKADAVEEHQRPLYYSWSRSWILPLNFFAKSAQMPQEDVLIVSRRVHNDIGFPLFVLPVRHKYSAYAYEPKSPEPVEGEWVSWTPFWVTSGTVPEGVHDEIEAGGVGLFFSRIAMDAPTQNTLLWHALWSLGPFYYSVDNKMPQASQAQEPAYQNMTLFMPVAAGGLAGSIVWIDGTLKSQRPGLATHVEAHGPLLGTLGYLEYNTTKESVDQKMRFIGTGLLWTDLRTIDPASEGEFSAHGPLWTMFGWGKKKGRNGVRLFWIPITF